MEKNTLIKDDKIKTSAQYRIDEEGRLILVYVNHNKRQKWYEIYNIYGACCYEVDKDYLLDKTKKANPFDYTSLTNSLLSGVFKNDNINIINRLPKL